VVVTGLGVCAPNGVGVDAFWKALLAGRSGIGPIKAFDASKHCSRIAGEVDFDVSSLPKRLVKRTARFAQMAVLAAHESLAHAGLEEGSALEECAVVVGSGIGGFEVSEAEHTSFVERGLGKYNPLTVPMIIPNMGAGMIAMETGARGPNMGVTSACASGANAIGTAFDLVRQGRCETALAGASESTISPWAVDGYCQLRALSTRNESPQTASRPFSADRDGFVIAEGAAVLVLESLEHARARGAVVLAELAGYGATADGYHITAPDPEGCGAMRAMRAALDDAGVATDAIDVINAHGTSTPLNDVTETNAIKGVFGAHARKLAVHATKSMTGHALGGASAMEAVVSVLTLVHGVIHPTINLETPDPACDLDYVANTAREARVRHVLSNAFGFGGHNAVLVFASAAGL
jgi:3-oxoacyl-[acyl-carrier-protein] synthase II